MSSQTNPHPTPTYNMRLERISDRCYPGGKVTLEWSTSGKIGCGCEAHFPKLLSYLRSTSVLLISYPIYDVTYAAHKYLEHWAWDALANSR